MKTAISVPDELFEKVEKWASVLGVGRSAFFQRAAEAYVERLAAESLTERMNAALDLVGEDDSWRDISEAGLRILADEAEDW